MFTVTEAAFAKLVAIEPRLESLRERIDAINRESRGKWRVCANWHWYGVGSAYGGLRGEMSALVGWDADNRALRSQSAYDTAYDFLYARLPRCRNCRCVGSRS